MNTFDDPTRRPSPVPNRRRIARLSARRSAVDALEPRRLFDGLTGQYFNSLDFTEPVVTKLDPTVDFTWSGSPTAGVNSDFFSARWTGQVQAATTETYTFSTTADDGVRLWVDGRLLVDNWQNQGATTRTGTVALEAGKRYDLRLDYYDYDLSGRLLLAWRSPTIPTQAIPASRLFAAPAGLRATYFDNVDFTAPALSRVDATVDFAWPFGTPDAASVAADGFSARWTGYFVPATTETYTFSVVSGDPTNLTLRVDGELLVDPSSDQDDGRIFMEAGKRYPIVLAMSDAGGPANVSIKFRSPSLPLQTVPAAQLFTGAENGVPSRRATYTNPVINADQPDPGVIFADGYYWMTHTMGGPDTGWPLWKSSDMVSWTYVKQLLTTSNKQPWMAGNYWAPEIHKVGNKFVITGTSTDARVSRLVIAMGSSDRIDGTYAVRSEPLVSDSVAVLDSNIFQDDDGRRYLLWKRDSATSGGVRGTIRIRELDATGLNFAAGSTARVILDNETGGWEQNLAEAPWLVRRDDAYYLFYSGAFIDTSYKLGVARSTSLTTMFARNPANPIIANNATWGGPGHGGFAADRDGNLWHLYHARQQSDPNAGRKQVLDPVVWTAGGWPTFPNNSVSATPRLGPHVDAASGAGVLTVNGDLSTSGQADLFRVVRGADASTLDVYLNGTVVASAPFAEVQQLLVNGLGGGDIMVLDYSRGDVVPGTGLRFDGGAGADVVRVLAAPGDAPYRHVAAGTLAAGTGVFTYFNAERLALVGGDHQVNADLSGVSLDVIGGTTRFNVAQRLGALALSNDATVTLASGDRTLVVTSLAVAAGASLDLTDGLLVVDYTGASPAAAVESLVRGGYAGGTWAGSGVASSVAAAAGNTLGVAEASAVLPATPTFFGGVAVDGTAVLVRYTVPGDVTLDRAVGFDDLLTLSQHYGETGAPYASGDVDYSPDGAVDFGDLLILAQHYGATLDLRATPAVITTRARRERANADVLA